MKVMQYNGSGWVGSKVAMLILGRVRLGHFSCVLTETLHIFVFRGNNVLLKRSAKSNSVK